MGAYKVCLSSLYLGAQRVFSGDKTKPKVVRIKTVVVAFSDNLSGANVLDPPQRCVAIAVLNVGIETSHAEARCFTVTMVFELPLELGVVISKGARRQDRTKKRHGDAWL
jgi:hypothetical protein